MRRVGATQNGSGVFTLSDGKMGLPQVGSGKAVVLQQVWGDVQKPSVDTSSVRTSDIWGEVLSRQFVYHFLFPL